MHARTEYKNKESSSHKFSGLENNLWIELGKESVAWKRNLSMENTYFCLERNYFYV
jgi:hypothetical protein